MSLAPIYTIYGLPYTTFRLGVRHTSPAGLLGALTLPHFPTRLQTSVCAK